MGWDTSRFPEDPDPELLCCICQGVLEDAVVSPCEHVFCSICVKEWLKESGTCPNCRRRINEQNLRQVIPLVKNLINKLKIFCDYKEKGCDEITTIDGLQQHLKRCIFAPSKRLQEPEKRKSLAKTIFSSFKKSLKSSKTSTTLKNSASASSAAEADVDQYLSSDISQLNSNNETQTNQPSDMSDISALFESSTYLNNVTINFTPDGEPYSHTLETLPYTENLTSSSSEDETKEIEMYKRHREYFKAALEISVKMWCDLRQYEPLSVIRDMNFFMARYAHLIESDVTCDGCLVSLPLNKYRCLTCLELDLCESCYINGIVPKSHLNTHRMIGLSTMCNGCQALIIQTHYRCFECPDTVFCADCHASENFPAMHTRDHSVTRQNVLHDDFPYDEFISQKTTENDTEWEIVDLM